MLHYNKSVMQAFTSAFKENPSDDEGEQIFYEASDGSYPDSRSIAPIV